METPLMGREPPSSCSGRIGRCCANFWRRNEGQDVKSYCCIFCTKFWGVLFIVIFICAWIVQGTMYYYAMLGCGPRALKGYDFPGSEASQDHEAAWNLQPRISLITERTGTPSSQAWDSIPSNDASTVEEAPNGVWWSTWGPIFNTYTFEDVVNSQKTIYMRRNLLRLGMSHRIRRCDGKGPMVTFSENSNFFINRIRLFFRMNQGMSFKIYLDNQLVAIAEETSRGIKSMTFRSKETSEIVASAVLRTRHFHGAFDQWLVKSEHDSPLPYYVPDAAAVLFSAHINDAEEKERKKHPQHHHTSTEPPYGDDPFLFEAGKLEANMTDADREKADALHQALKMYGQVEPPNWVHEHDASAPLLALGAVFLVPLLGVPLMVCCKNGNMKKVWSAQ